MYGCGMQSSTVIGAGAASLAVVDSVFASLMAVGRTVRQRMTGDDLDPAQFWLVKAIAAGEPLRATELAGCTQLDTSTVSRHVTQLHRAGLLKRTPDPDDGRAHRLELTAEGRACLDDAVERRRALLARALGTWEPGDVEQLDRLLARFVTDLHLDLDPPRENP